ncbi:response regulator [Cohnella sp. JJ-181]|uniref:response regulator n=1 Tax=Cohnella rhizoplanae TaxID=2974897 RepID=UPI0022FFC0E2|nr:response regulator [Cohnella sp. JJ-181]CAI6085792.1 HTH-type transcriptional activator RhaR [Cohnella sp. JJ-181]
MKLLIVEDERMTREGILEAIEWRRIGITEVREAWDGKHALAIAEDYLPDIVLTDIRMPRMDGIAFATELRRTDPDCKLIFMSGYADKPYLKAAITLQAIQYVEKPIEIEEIEEAVAKAAAQRRADLCRRGAAMAAAETIETGAALIKQEAALRLIGGPFDEQTLRARLRTAGFSLPDPVACATILLKAAAPEARTEAVAANVAAALETSSLEFLFARKNERHYVVHLFGTDRGLSEAALKETGAAMAAGLGREFRPYAVAVGRPVEGLASLNRSYTSAVVRMQQAFYRSPGAVVAEAGDDSPADPDAIKPCLNELQEALRQERFEEADRCVQRLTLRLRERPSMHVNTTKDLYYRMLVDMDAFAAARGIELFPPSAGENPPWQLVHDCDCLDDVQDEIRRTLHRLRDAVSERGRGGTASRVMKYVHSRYADAELSVGDIAEHLQITPSHLIAVFRESTGKTVKQYLTEYRIEIAKQLLVRERLKMTDLASQAGFKDAESFAKQFRKQAGMTPSEYRDRFRP